jgi:Ca2+/Na+ antiporter
MDMIASLAFTAVFFVLVFGYAAYRDKKQAEIERMLIEQGKADAVVELRRLRREGVFAAFSSGREGREMDPWLPVAIGVAAIVSGAILYLAAPDLYNHADLWFVILGIFSIAWGLARRLAKPHA